jgi:hypothetical protein
MNFTTDINEQGVETRRKMCVLRGSDPAHLLKIYATSHNIFHVNFGSIKEPGLKEYIQLSE